MEVAIRGVEGFLVLYFTYYYALRFIQFVLEGSIGYINTGLAKFLYGLSTPAHELAHLLVAVLCFATIDKVQLFPRNGKPGYVAYRIGSSIPFFVDIKKFFIGMAPALINIPVFIFLESEFVLKCKISQLGMIINPTVIFSKEGLITFILFILLISGIAPSHQDLKGMVKGLILFSVIIFGVSYFTGVMLNFKGIDITGVVAVVLYYLEVIALVLVLNAVLNFNNFFRITANILKNSLKHTFSRG